MRSNITCAAMLAAIILGAATVRAADNELTEQEKKDGWILLFDGKSWDGWSAAGKKLNDANVKDGTLNTLKSGGYVAFYDKQKFGDFTVAMDFKVSPKCNSGIFIRVADPKNPVQTGFEIQVMDSFGKEKMTKHECGALYDAMEPSANAVKKAGEWNHIEITFKGNKVQVVLNDQKVVDADLDKWTEVGKNPDGTKNKYKTAYKDMAKEGYIGMQDHGHDCWYKNVKVKPLK